VRSLGLRLLHFVVHGAAVWGDPDAGGSQDLLIDADGSVSMSISVDTVNVWRMGTLRATVSMHVRLRNTEAALVQARRAGATGGRRPGSA